VAVQVCASTILIVGRRQSLTVTQTHWHSVTDGDLRFKEVCSIPGHTIANIWNIECALTTSLTHVVLTLEIQSTRDGKFNIVIEGFDDLSVYLLQVYRKLAALDRICAQAPFQRSCA